MRQMGFDRLDDPDSDILEIFLEATAGILASILVLMIAYWVVVWSQDVLLFSASPMSKGILVDIYVDIYKARCWKACFVSNGECK